MKSLKGKRILVIGAGGGIGKACVKRLRAEGAYVYTSDLEGTLEDRDGLYDRPSDVTDSTSLDRLFASVAAKSGGLDGFIYSAGIGSSSGFWDTTMEHFDRVISVNLRAAFYTARRAANLMEHGGSIVFIASQKGLCGSTGSLAYNTSKGGMIIMARSMALELGSKSIRVNCVCPGPTDTAMFRRDMENQADPWTAEKKAAASNPLNRIADPDQIASGVAYVISDEASFMTGTELVIDGGDIAGVRNI